MLADSPVAHAKEYEVSDYDNFAGLFIRKDQSLSEVSAYARLIAQHGALGVAVIQHTGDNMNDSVCLLKEYYQGVMKAKLILREIFHNEQQE